MPTFIPITIIIRIAVVALALTEVVSIASAQDPVPRNPCGKDQAKLCVGVKPGEGRMIACMVKQKNKLSAECTQLLIKMGALK